MKKTIAILISVFMAVSFSACRNSENESVTEPVQTAAETQSELILEDNIDKSAAELVTDLEKVETDETVSEAEVTAAAETEQETVSETTQITAAPVETTQATTTAPQVQESKILRNTVAKRKMEKLSGDIIFPLGIMQYRNKVFDIF